MKRILIVSLIAVFAIIVTASNVQSQSSTDYKVIKNAVKKNGSTWKEAKNLVMHMDIQDLKKKTNIKIEIPFNIVEFFLENCKDSKMHFHGDVNELKLMEAITKIKASGPMTMIEVNFPEEDSKVKIWLE